MKKIMCCLMICACFAGTAYAQGNQKIEGHSLQDGKGQGEQSAEETARQKYALDLKKVGVSKAVKNALKEGVLSVKDLITVAIAQGVKPVNILTTMSINGVNSNDIIAARVEGVTAEQVTTAYAAVEQFKADVAKSDNVDAAVKSAIDGGVLTLDSIIEVAVVLQGVNPTNMLTAMNNSGVNVTDAKAAAGAFGITDDTVQLAYDPVVPSDEPQPYTPPEDRGQPDTPIDRGQRPDTMPVNAATPAFPTFALPAGPIGGGTNGPPEDFTPASPSRPI